MRHTNDMEKFNIAKKSKRQWFGPFNDELKTLEYFFPPFILQCKECQAVFIQDKCDNCNSVDEWEIQQGTNMFGVFCRQCGAGFYTWRCIKCKIENSVSGTLLLLE